jgi:hypothetical protein
MEEQKLRRSLGTRLPIEDLKAVNVSAAIVKNGHLYVSSVMKRCDYDAAEGLTSKTLPAAVIDLFRARLLAGVCARPACDGQPDLASEDESSCRKRIRATFTSVSAGHDRTGGRLWSYARNHHGLQCGSASARRFPLELIVRVSHIGIDPQ